MWYDFECEFMVVDVNVVVVVEGGCGCDVLFMYVDVVD